MILNSKEKLQSSTVANSVMKFVNSFHGCEGFTEALELGLEKWGGRVPGLVVRPAATTPSSAATIQDHHTFQTPYFKDLRRTLGLEKGYTWSE